MLKRTKLLSVILLAFGLSVTACGGNLLPDADPTNQDNQPSDNTPSGEEDTTDVKIKQVYQLYAENMIASGQTPMTYEEWLASIKGEKGDTGAQGPQGEQGIQGPQGPQGPAGANGSSVFIEQGSPAATLGSDGDLYIDSSTWSFYMKENGSWVFKGSISGGSQGGGGGQGEGGENENQPQPVMNVLPGYYVQSYIQNSSSGVIQTSFTALLIKSDNTCSYCSSLTDVTSALDFRADFRGTYSTSGTTMTINISGATASYSMREGNKLYYNNEEAYHWVREEQPDTIEGKVALASTMTLEQLKIAAEAEAEADPGFSMKVLGLTSVLRTVATDLAAECEWLSYTYSGGSPEGNIDVNNTYKDDQLLATLDDAKDGYVADIAIVEDARAMSGLVEDGTLINYVPSDASSYYAPTVELNPLPVLSFNRVFWTNTNFETVNGFGLHNIWQLAGSSSDQYHVSKVSLLSPLTDLTNMSFLASCYAPENQARIEKAYKDFYGRDWAPSGSYQSAGEQWVREFINNVTKFHSSDGTAMKETQIRDEWNSGVVYFGWFAKMKDAATRNYDVDLDGNGYIEDTPYIVQCGGVTYTYPSEQQINAMDTVKWDWDIDGFNGYFYNMYAQIVKNAKYPYNACLFARTMLEEYVYCDAIYNARNPDTYGNPANQYGYYYAGQVSSNFRYAKGDWTKEQHMQKELNENYQYLKSVSIDLINAIAGYVTERTNAL